MEFIEKIINVETGSETTRIYTASEIAEVEAEIAATQDRLVAQEKAEKAREAVLAKLGLTADEAKILMS